MAVVSARSDAPLPALLEPEEEEEVPEVEPPVWEPSAARCWGWSSFCGACPSAEADSPVDEVDSLEDDDAVAASCFAISCSA